MHPVSTIAIRNTGGLTLASCLNSTPLHAYLRHTPFLYSILMRIELNAIVFLSELTL